MEKLAEAETEPGEWVLRVFGSGVIVLDREGSGLPLAEALLGWGSSPVQFRRSEEHTSELQSR